MEIQMRKIQGAQRVPCRNIRVDVQFILAEVCYTFAELGNSFILTRYLFARSAARQRYQLATVR